MHSYGLDAHCVLQNFDRGHEAVPKRLRLVSHGCSSGFGGNMFNTANMDPSGPRAALEPCCDLRHACYGTCGNSRKRCDDAFKKCASKKCAATKVGDTGFKEECDREVNMLTLMSGLVSCHKFDARRDSAEDFSRLNALLFTAVAWIFIPAYCFAVP